MFGALRGTFDGSTLALIARPGPRPIADTGLSQLQDQPQLTGTPIYMAPELVDRHLVDHRADLYSPGIMRYELVCGTAPFTGRTTLQLLAQHQTRAIAFDGDGRRVPEWLRPIILKLCAKEPSERF